jgi:hypothetical protein
MAFAKNIIFQYSDDPWLDQFEIDHEGKLAFERGDIIYKGGKTWRVESMVFEDTEKDGLIPTIWIWLTEPLVN